MVEHLQKIQNHQLYNTPTHYPQTKEERTLVALAEIMFVRVGSGWRIVIFATNATGVEVKVVLYFSCSCDNFCSVSNNSLSYYEGHHESQVIFHNKSSTIEFLIYGMYFQ